MSRVDNGEVGENVDDRYHLWSASKFTKSVYKFGLGINIFTMKSQRQSVSLFFEKPKLFVSRKKRESRLKFLSVPCQTLYLIKEHGLLFDVAGK